MPASENLVSIIIPTYNEPASCIDKLRDLPSMVGVLQVIIVDASDEPLSQQGLASLDGVEGLTVIIADQKGRGAQMNQGAAQATAPVFLFLHADSLLHEEAAKMVIKALKAGYYWGRFEAKLTDERWPFRVIEWAMNKRSALTHVATGDQALFMTREAFDIVDGFDVIELMEDVAMSKKLQRIGPVCAVPMKVQTSARRWQQQGIIKTIGLMWWLRFRYFLGAPPSELAKSYQQVRSPLALNEGASETPIYLFAKAPEAGQVKSRLCPPLNADQAAVVATELLNIATNKLVTYWKGRVLLAVSPDASHETFTQLTDNYGMNHIQQSGDDLGQRMLNAIAHGLKSAPAAAVIGADIPSITEEILNSAHQSMLEGKCVIGPTTDGGFYLLGLNVAPEALFANIEWGGDTVYQQLMSNADQLGIVLNGLPTLQDCDYWADLQQLAGQDSSFGEALFKAGIDTTAPTDKPLESL